MITFMHILCVVFALETSLAFASDGTGFKKSGCQADIVNSPEMAHFTTYSQFIAEDYRNIDFALHISDISPHISRGQFAMVSVGDREDLIVVVSRALVFKDIKDFTIYLIPVNQHHLARVGLELDRAVDGHLNEVVRDHYAASQVRRVENEKVGLAYFELNARLDDLGRFHAFLRRLDGLTR